MNLNRWASAGIISLTLVGASYFSACSVSVDIDKYMRSSKVEWVVVEPEDYYGVYYKDVDFDDSLEKIVIRSHRLNTNSNDWDYSNAVEIYNSTSKGYDLKRCLKWIGQRVTEKNIIFGARILNVRGKEIIYHSDKDNFYCSWQGNSKLLALRGIALLFLR